MHIKISSYIFISRDQYGPLASCLGLIKNIFLDFLMPNTRLMAISSISLLKRYQVPKLSNGQWCRCSHGVDAMDSASGKFPSWSERSSLDGRKVSVELEL